MRCVVRFVLIALSALVTCYSACAQAFVDVEVVDGVTGQALRWDDHMIAYGVVVDIAAGDLGPPWGGSDPVVWARRAGSDVAAREGGLMIPEGLCAIVERSTLASGPGVLLVIAAEHRSIALVWLRSGALPTRVTARLFPQRDLEVLVVDDGGAFVVNRQVRMRCADVDSDRVIAVGRTNKEGLWILPRFDWYLAVWGASCFDDGDHPERFVSIWADVGVSTSRPWNLAERHLESEIVQAASPRIVLTVPTSGELRVNLRNYEASGWADEVEVSVVETTGEMYGVRRGASSEIVFDVQLGVRLRVRAYSEQRVVAEAGVDALVHRGARPVVTLVDGRKE